MPKTIKLVPPDGGWGWIVLSGIAVSYIFNMSILSIFSLLYGDVLEDMGHRTKGAALVMNTAFFISIFSGPIAGAMVKLTSPRLVAVTGACTCTLAIFFSAFSTNIWHLVFAYGVLLGFGLDFVALSTFVVINNYFTDKKSRALGLAMIGTSVGQMLMPHLVEYLLKNYGFRGACLLLSSLSFQGVAGCMLLQPVELHMMKIENEEPAIAAPNEICEDNTQNDHVINQIIEPNAKTKPIMQNTQARESYTVNENSEQSNNKTSIDNNPPIVDMNSSTANASHLNVSSTTTVSNSFMENKSRLMKLYDLFGIALLCNIRFINIFMGIALCSTSMHNFSMLYPLFLEESKVQSRISCAIVVSLSEQDSIDQLKTISFEKQQIANCMSTVAVADICGRFILPMFQDKYKIKARWIFIITCIWLIIVRQIMAHQNTFIVILIMSTLYGFGRSMVVVQRNLTMSENCKADEVPIAVGLSRFFTGIAALPLGYLLGWIRDSTDSYIASITAQDALLVILLVTWLPDMLYVYFNKNK